MSVHAVVSLLTLITMCGCRRCVCVRSRAAPLRIQSPPLELRSTATSLTDLTPTEDENHTCTSAINFCYAVLRCKVKRVCSARRLVGVRECAAPLRKQRSLPTTTATKPIAAIAHRDEIQAYMSDLCYALACYGVMCVCGQRR